MIPKYRKRAWIILLVSIALFVALLSLRRVFTNGEGRQFNRFGIGVFLALACLYLYGCYTLVKAKGQSSALLLFAIPCLCLPMGAGLIAPLAIAVAASDRFSGGNVQKRRRIWGWMERRRRR
jgi:drug/metabolite transporter (DMT)-like permease